MINRNFSQGNEPELAECGGASALTAPVTRLSVVGRSVMSVYLGNITNLPRRVLSLGRHPGLRSTSELRNGASGDEILQGVAS
jgi:hypothetical protein